MLHLMFDLCVEAWCEYLGEPQEQCFVLVAWLRENADDVARACHRQGDLNERKAVYQSLTTEIN